MPTPPSSSPVSPASGSLPFPTSPTVDQIMASSPELNRNHVIKYFPYLAAEMAAQGWTTRNHVVAIIAIVTVETGTFAPNLEEGGPYRYDPYRGRGFFQMTWKDCYAAASKVVGQDLVAHPDLAMDPVISAKCAIWEGSGGQLASHDLRPYINAGDFLNVRYILNTGKPNNPIPAQEKGNREFMEIIQKCLKNITGGLNGAASPNQPSGYGVGCVDANSNRQLTGAQSASDALSMALGIQLLDNANTHSFHCIVDVASQPDVLDLDAQKTFNVKGFGGELDGEYTVREIVYYFGPTLQAEIFAYKPDPNAPQTQAFAHDPLATGANGAAVVTGAAPPPGGINGAIYQAALASFGADSSSGPEGGYKACAWCINHLVFPKAGIQPMGDTAVAEVEAALNSGRGQPVVPLNTAQPGDIWLVPGEHIGVVIAPGAAVILSNSSSKAKFNWKGSLEEMDRYYHGGSKIYRVTK